MYIVEGNIGAGKSTFLKLIEAHAPEITTHFESFANGHTDKQGPELLNNFYHDPARWAYTLETHVMMTRVQNHQLLQAQKNKNAIIERSIYSGHHCFAQNSYANGFMSLVEWHMYNQLFNFLIPTICKAPLGFIYLRVTPEIAHQRIVKRNRPGEKTITLDYLTQIHERHESFLVSEKRKLPYISITPVLILECNDEFETNRVKLHEHIAQVKQFLKYTQSTFTPAKTDWQMLRREPVIDDELQNN